MSMEHIHLWQMMVDAGLIVSLLVLCVRAFRSSQVLNPRTMELESSLRALITEADGAGRTLNDQLMRREQALQKLLTDIEGAEHRLHTALNNAEDLTRAIGVDTAKANQVIQELGRSLSDVKDELARDSAAPEQSPPRFERSAGPRAPQRHSYHPARTTLVDEIEIESVEIENNRIEVAGTPMEQSNPYATESKSAKDMRAVYASAEEMIKAGEAVDQVSVRTRIPVEELRLLSQMVEIEREEESKTNQSLTAVTPSAPRDSRLGVLGSMKRQVQTL